MAVAACDEDHKPEGKECASEDEISDYFYNRGIAFIEIKNYINYKTVDDKPVQRMLEWSFSQFFAKHTLYFKQITIIET